MNKHKRRSDYWEKKLRGVCIMAGCNRRATNTVRCTPCQDRENERKRSMRRRLYQARTTERTEVLMR